MDALSLFNKLKKVCENAACEIILMDDVNFSVRWTWRIKNKGKEDTIAYTQYEFNYFEIDIKGLDSIDCILDDIRDKIREQIAFQSEMNSIDNNLPFGQVDIIY